MRVCSIEGCGQTHFGRGWCAMHYDRWRRTGDPQPDKPKRIAAPKHGTTNMYNTYGCRCDACREANRVAHWLYMQRGDHLAKHANRERARRAKRETA